MAVNREVVRNTPILKKFIDITVLIAKNDKPFTINAIKASLVHIKAKLLVVVEVLLNALSKF
jgi:hypothetical protein